MKGLVDLIWWYFWLNEGQMGGRAGHLGVLKPASLALSLSLSLFLSMCVIVKRINLLPSLIKEVILFSVTGLNHELRSSMHIDEVHTTHQL